MGVSCVRRLGLSAIMTLLLVRCASAPYEVASTGALDQNERAQQVVQSCHEALVRSAEPYGLMLAATSPVGQGATIWPIWVTAVYRRQGGPEKRTALIDCHLQEGRGVVALTAGEAL
jgi:hypothetical protein